MTKPWRCKLFGHRLDYFGAWYYNVDRCHRCSPYGNGCVREVWDAGWRERLKTRVWLAGQWLRDLWWSWRWRWDRDKRDDDIPF
jgi:hypothetical protein